MTDILMNSSPELSVLHQSFDRFESDKYQVTILPTLHNQLQFSQISSQLLTDNNYDLVMVELPLQLQDQFLMAIDRLPLTTVLHNNHLETKGEYTLTPSPQNAYVIHPGESLYWTCFQARRSGIPVKFMDTWHPDAYQTWKVPIGFEHLAAIGWAGFWEQGSALVEQHLHQPVHQNRSWQMKQKLLQELELMEEGKILIVIGAAHWPAMVIALQELKLPGTTMIPETVITKYQQFLLPDSFSEHPIGTWSLADIHPHSLHLVTGQFPFYLGLLVEDPLGFEILEGLRQLYFSAEARYKQKFDDQVSPASYRRMFQYLRNLGRLQGMVLPDLHNLIVGAKGMVDDDYAFEVYRTAISYPFLPQKEQRLDEVLKFTPDEKQGEIIRFAFKRRFKRPVLKKVDQDEFDDLDPIPEEDYAGQWQDIWDRLSPFGYVSYPPEDEFIENYMQFLRKRIIEILMEEESATMEFESSLEDGIDWRETMRNYHEGKIYVKKFPKNKYTVGALIIQFLEEPYDDDEYSYHSTLFAEHDQESHISVITTRPGEVLVGPGISRVKYAAIISQFPPVAMPYLISKDNVDLKLRLIWAAMNMSLNKIIGFVARKPPTASQRHFAAEHGFRLVFLPMGQLTAQSLRRLRTMHLIAHRNLRDNAREYIGF